MILFLFLLIGFNTHVHLKQLCLVLQCLFQFLVDFSSSLYAVYYGWQIIYKNALPQLVTFLSLVCTSIAHLAYGNVYRPEVKSACMTQEV